MKQSFTCGGKQIGLDVIGLDEGREDKRPAILLMHGSGGNVDFWFHRLEPLLSQAGVLLFGLHYFDRTGTVRADLATITDGVHVPLWLDTLDSAIQHVAAHPQVDPKRLALVGISLGAYLSMSWAALQSARSAPAGPQVRCIVELSGGLTEPYASQATGRLPPTLIIHGDQDHVVPVGEARRLDDLLTRLGVAHEVHILPGESHWFRSAAQWQLLLAVSGFLSRYLQR